MQLLSRLLHKRLKRSAHSRLVLHRDCSRVLEGRAALTQGQFGGLLRWHVRPGLLEQDDPRSRDPPPLLFKSHVNLPDTLALDTAVLGDARPASRDGAASLAAGNQHPERLRQLVYGMVSFQKSFQHPQRTAWPVQARAFVCLRAGTPPRVLPSASYAS